MDPTILPTTDADMPFLVEMLVLTLWTQPQFAARSGGELETLARFEIMGWQPGKDFAFVAWRGPQRVGAVWLNGGGEVGGKTFTIGLAVLPENQGQGYGTRLLEYVLQFSAEQRAISVDLKVHPSNERALRLYRKFGFEPGMLEMKKQLKS